MIGKGERLILTGYDDVLHIRLEPFVTDGWPPNRYIEQRITWEMLTHAVIDVLPQVIGAMREKLARVPGHREEPPMNPDWDDVMKHRARQPKPARLPLAPTWDEVRAGYDARIQRLEGENAALREALTEAHARMVYLFQALPFEQRHRWGGDVAEFIEGIDAGRGEQQAP